MEYILYTEICRIESESNPYTIFEKAFKLSHMTKKPNTAQIYSFIDW